VALLRHGPEGFRETQTTRGQDSFLLIYTYEVAEMFEKYENVTEAVLREVVHPQGFIVTRFRLVPMIRRYFIFSRHWVIA
jgi:hypothetical protein